MSHSYRTHIARNPDGSTTRTVTRLHPGWRRIGKAACLWVAIVWPLTIGAHNGTPTVLGWVLFACWLPVAVAVLVCMSRKH